MRWMLLLVSLGGCAVLRPPPAEPVPPRPRPAADSVRHEPAAPLTARQADPDRPRTACDDEGAPIAQWPDALVEAADSLR